MRGPPRGQGPAARGQDGGLPRGRGRRIVGDASASPWSCRLGRSSSTEAPARTQQPMGVQVRRPARRGPSACAVPARRRADYGGTRPMPRGRRRGDRRARPQDAIAARCPRASTRAVEGQCTSGPMPGPHLRGHRRERAGVSTLQVGALTAPGAHRRCRRDGARVLTSSTRAAATNGPTRQSATAPVSLQSGVRRTEDHATTGGACGNACALSNVLASRASASAEAHASAAEESTVALRPRRASRRCSATC